MIYVDFSFGEEEEEDFNDDSGGLLNSLNAQIRSNFPKF
jgi:hypothetical protein